jgi:type VI secretion system secreted protein VgrG
MGTTQDERLLSINTLLGKDVLLLNSYKCKERLSELFEIEVELLREENHGGSHSFTPVDVAKTLGKNCSILVEQEDGGQRRFSGIFATFHQLGRDSNFSKYTARIVPHVWRLTQNFKSRIFQQSSVPDILQTVFEGYEIIFQLGRQYGRRNYCVQYQESDFDFASRLMEEEGIYYYFEHTSETDRMIVRDDYRNPEDCPGKSRIPIFDGEVDGANKWESTVGDLLINFELSSGKFVYWDYNFELPTKKLDVEETSRFSIGNNQDMEVYKYPGGYGRKYDGIDKTGGEQPSELDNIFEDNKNTSVNEMLANDSGHKKILGHSNCVTLTAGYRFQLENHPNKDLNRDYILVSVSHSAAQQPGYLIGSEGQEGYSNTFACIPHGSGAPEFRPLKKTPRPKILGSQSAFVVGPPGEEVFTDKYGRVKVQFHWDREGQADSSSSCWLRVAQTWAGNRWGTMFIPRVGMEVLVSFIEGDPDQPVISGSVYNPQTMPPYDLPEEKTKSTVKSNSSKGGEGFNELRFEDKKGAEQIFVHGEKDLDLRIKNDAKEIIKRDRHLIVENNQHEEVTRDKHLKVGGDKNEEVTGTVSLTTQNIQNKVKQNYAVDATSEVHIKGGTNVVLQSNTSLTLKVGSNFIQINSGGVFIKGTMVMLNSGGAAGSGSGASPNSPEQPLEADDAVPGKKSEPAKRQPPPLPNTFSPMGEMLASASITGTPFCEP